MKKTSTILDYSQHAKIVCKNQRRTIVREPFYNPKQIYFAKVKGNAIIPTRQSENAGYDFYATFDEEYILVEPYKTKLIPTGIAWASSEEYYLQIEERSSTGTKGIKRSCGVIDSGYRGEIKIAIFNANDVPLVFSEYSEEDIRRKHPELGEMLFYSTSKAIAQGIVHRVEDVQPREISLEALLLIPSKRGDGGWGSSGK